MRILWQRLDFPGHEISTLDQHADGWRLSGTALVAYENRPCKVDYRIECDTSWRTKSVTINGTVGERAVSLEITRSANDVWNSNGVHVPGVDGCIDVDLGFSPSTNLLPIRRLQLAVGDHAAVRAAWVRFPEFSLELLSQSYTRLDENHYLYESAGGAFRRELLTNAHGFVLEYPDYWRTDAVIEVSDSATSQHI